MDWITVQQSVYRSLEIWSTIESCTRNCSRKNQGEFFCDTLTASTQLKTINRVHGVYSGVHTWTNHRRCQSMSRLIKQKLRNWPNQLNNSRVCIWYDSKNCVKLKCDSRRLRGRDLERWIRVEEVLIRIRSKKIDNLSNKSLAFHKVEYIYVWVKCKICPWCHKIL